ncbi:MAG TPA: pyruvate, phosphate dikinase, partial [Clostridia bacterium]|nr:pyruvate, phosphate dikinase [Clostridia bacterium]
MASKTYVYLFSEADGKNKNLFGGKGANLAEMTGIGLPVPPGLTITTEACKEYLAGDGRFPDGLEEELKTKMKELEKVAGKVFGDPANPLLVSVRSGAPISMPGMMDTILNLGLNDETVQG